MEKVGKFSNMCCGSVRSLFALFWTLEEHIDIIPRYQACSPREMINQARKRETEHLILWKRDTAKGIFICFWFLK